MITRVLTALVLAPAATFTIFRAPQWLFLALCALVAVGCLFEFHRLAHDHGLEFPVGIAAATGLCIMLSTGEQALLAALFGVMATLVVALRQIELAMVLRHASGFALGILYCFATWRCGIDLREMAPFWLLYALALNWIGDAFAYLGGRAMGRHKLAPRVSPAKTWEGSAWSIAGAVGFGWAFLGYFAPEWSGAEIVALSVAANVAGQLGDLVESALKRGSGRKDSGGLLPGHGGLLDRLDSSLFTMPVVLLWLTRVR